jgi:hypothetical protein
MRSRFGIDTMDRTTPHHASGDIRVRIVAFEVVASVGTGGDYTAAYHSLREDKRLVRSNRSTGTKSNGFAVSSDIDHAKSVLNLTMSEIARCIGVSRQSLYNWIAGGSIKHENLSKLIELKSAADVIAAEGLPERALLLRRKLPGGKTLLETIAAGGSGADAALALVRLADQEARQRAELARLFAGRAVQNSLGHEVPRLNES